MRRREVWAVIAGVIGTALVGCGLPPDQTVSRGWRTQQEQTAGKQQAAFGAIARAQSNLQAAHDAAQAGKPGEVARYLQLTRRDLDEVDFAAAFPQKTTVVPEFVMRIDQAVSQLNRAQAGNWVAASTADFLVKDITEPLQKALTSTQLQLMR
jgi:hypothetical protein